MNNRKLIFFLLLLITALFLSGCSGGSFAATSWPGLSASDDQVFVAYNTHVYAVNSQNGTELWRFPQEADANVTFFAPPTLTADGQLIVGGYDNTIYSLDPQTGTPNPWTFTEAKNRFIGSVLSIDNRLFAPNADGNLYSLNTAGTRVENPFYTGKPQWATPIFNDSTLFLTSLDHNVYAINMDNLTKRWQTDLNSAPLDSPMFLDGTLYISTLGNKVVALDAASGTVKCEYNTEGWIWSSPTAYEGVIYFGDINGTLYAMNENCEPAWDQPFKADSGIYGSPLAVDSTVYFGTEGGTVYALGLNGVSQWSKSLGGTIYESPTLSQDLIIFVAVEEGSTIQLAALEKDGTVQWRFTPAEKE